MAWKYSAVGMRALKDALLTRQDAQLILTRVKPATRAALESPSAQRWHDGSVVVDLTVVMDEVAGGDAVEELYYQHVKRSIGPLAAPFVKVALSLGGNDPRTVFTRLDRLMASVLTGVTTTYTPGGEREGTLTIHHEDEVRPPSLRAWAGSIRFSFDLCGVSGVVMPRVEAFDGHLLVYDVRWMPKDKGGPG